MKKLTVLIVAIIVASCSAPSRKCSECTEIAVHLDAEQGTNVPFNLSDMIDSVSYVFIDNAFKVNELRTVKYYDGYYYVQDGPVRLLKVDSDGKVILEINRRGRKSGEYIGIGYFDIDPGNGDIVIFDNQRGNLLYYTSDGEFYKGRMLTQGLFDMATLSSGDLLFYMPKLIEGAAQNRGLWISSSSLENKSQLLRYDAGHTSIPHDISTRYLRRVGSEYIGFLDQYSNDIYHIGTDGVMARAYQLDFGRENPPAYFKGEMTDCNPSKDSRLFAIHQYFETAHWLVVSAVRDGHRTDLIYDKRTGTPHVAKDGNGFVVDGNAIWTQSWWWSAEDRLMAPFKPSKAGRISSQLFPSMDESDNPVIIVAHVN